jgi:hypothetical protein
MGEFLSMNISLREYQLIKLKQILRLERIIVRLSRLNLQHQFLPCLYTVLTTTQLFRL